LTWPITLFFARRIFGVHTCKNAVADDEQRRSGEEVTGGVDTMSLCSPPSLQNRSVCKIHWFQFFVVVNFGQLMTLTLLFTTQKQLGPTNNAILKQDSRGPDVQVEKDREQLT
jgi:hypothetical protein